MANSSFRRVIALPTVFMSVSFPAKTRWNTIIGFLGESSPQLNANTQRLWSLDKPSVKKNNTTKMRSNTFFGFYALNGESVVDFKENSKKESVCEFLEKKEKEIRIKP